MDTSCLYIAPVKRKVNPTFLQLSRPWRYFRLLMIIRACQLRILPATSQRVTDAVDALRRERIIAVPTDTLYGLAAGAHSDKSIRRLYAAKRRSETVPVAICVSDAKDVERYADTKHLAEGLLDELLPGPVTVLLSQKSSADLPLSLNPNSKLMGIRIPKSDFIRAVARQYGHALALTSANQSGSASTLDLNEFTELWDDCAFIFDGGRIVSGRVGSSVVDLSLPGRFSVQRR
mmetsp:Transcript_13525/g.53232  ORF Transcript_13525/g.53232 Transcript_13525/m.53232 type:complete len:233 (+) Transcript_13525:3755-4453(+)